MKTSYCKVVRLLFGLILTAVIATQQPGTSTMKTTQTGSNGAKVDIDANKVLNPNVHMLEGNIPLPINRRMTSGQTTIVDPGHSYLSDQPISSNIQNPRQLDLRAINQQSLPTSPEPLLQTLGSSVLQNNAALTSNTSQKKNLDEDYSKVKTLKPHFVYHPSNKQRLNLHRRHRRLDQVGTVSFPFERVPPESQVPAPPIVVKLNKVSVPAPELESSLEIWQTNRLNGFESKYFSASMGPEAKNLMNRDILLSRELASLVQNINKVNNKISEVEILAKDRNSKLEPEILAAKKMLGQLMIPNIEQPKFDESKTENKKI